jgi:enterochelin esterase-like enzyme
MKRFYISTMIAGVIFIILTSVNAQVRPDEMFLKSAQVDIPTIAQPAASQVMQVTVNSPGLLGNILEDSPDRRVSVYLPAAYYDNPTMRFPVIYLYGGYGAWHNFWFGMQYSSYNIKGWLDNLIYLGNINPVIVVSPDNYNKYQGSWFTNSSLAGNWEDFNVKDVVSYIDNNFRTIPRPESRGISGWSMGGYGAVKLAMKYPEVFGSLYSISGALLDFDHRIINWKEEKDGFIKSANLTHATFSLNSDLLMYFSIAIAFAPDKNAVGYGQMPVTASGETIDSVWQKYLAHNLATMVPQYSENLKKLNGIVLECGTGEPPIYNENASFSKILNDNGIEHELRIHGGNHQYSILNRMQTHVFPFFSEKLNTLHISADQICLGDGDTLKVNMFSSEGALYIAPIGTPETPDDIKDNAVKTFQASPAEQVKIPADNLAPGNYFAYGITDEGYIAAPVRFTVTTETPQLTIQLKEVYSGNPIGGYQVRIDGVTLLTGENGSVASAGCGKRNVQVTDSRLFGSFSTFMVYTDTTIVIETIKNSYLQLVDKATGKPLNRASFKYSYGTAISDIKGIAVIKVMPEDDKFEFKATHSDYFDLESILSPKYGDTTILALTRKTATTEFHVMDSSGPVSGQTVSLSGGNLTTNSSGMVKFSGRAARKEYQYKITRKCCLPVDEVFMLEIDTLIMVDLLPDTISPELQAEIAGDVLKLKSSKAGDVYLVPSGIVLHTDSIISRQLMKSSVVADVLKDISISSLSENPFMVCVIDPCGNMATWIPALVHAPNRLAPAFTLFPNPVKDVLTISTDKNVPYLISVTDINGRALYSKEVFDDLFHVDMSAMHSGLYVVSIITNVSIDTRKIVKF